MWKPYLFGLISFFFISVSGYSSSDFDRVQQLGLSYRNFMLGAPFQDHHDFALQKEAWPGTLRYKKKSLVVAVEARTHRLIALYEEYPALDPGELKRLVGTLVAQFGEPTFEAHDKMLFWYFTSKGKISSEEFERLRNTEKFPELLAVAKFSCSKNIIDFADKKRSKSRAKAYFTLYSPVLIKKFVQIQQISKNKNKK